MSDNFVNQLTLECLMNKDQYKRLVTPKVEQITNKKDKRFYRKRIMSLTRDFLYEDILSNESPDINYAFQMYIKTCINYFKILDKSDILQEEYVDIIDSVKELSESEIATQEEADRLMMRCIKIQENPTLDKFVKRTNTPVESQLMILPKQKDINLRDPILKNKGVTKKKKKPEII